MMGIAVRRESSQGVSEVNQAVNVMDFFQTQILPELQDGNHSVRPVLKAAAIKFVTVFRNQFEKQNLVVIMPMLIAHLSSPVVVVHTFAAYAIERILVTREDPNVNTSRHKFGSTEVQQFLQPLFTGLFTIIDNEESNENEYVMKCVMRSLATAREDILPVAQIVTTRLTDTLVRVAKNPKNPQFNHYLFESISVLVRSVCLKDPNATSQFEPLLFIPFNAILQQDVAEFTPYVFQILAQLLELRAPGTGLGEAYTQLFPPLLTPSIWEKKGNVPALARLFQAYIDKAAVELAPKLNPILGVFQKLLASKATEISAFEILNSAISHFPPAVMEPAIPTLFQLLLVRLQSSRTTKLLYNPIILRNRWNQNIVCFCSLIIIIGMIGGTTIITIQNMIQRGRNGGVGPVLLSVVQALQNSFINPQQRSTSSFSSSLSLSGLFVIQRDRQQLNTKYLFGNKSIFTTTTTRTKLPRSSLV